MSATLVNDRAQQALVLAHLIRKSAVWANQPLLRTPIYRNKLEAFAHWVAGNVCLWLKTRDGWQFTAVTQVLHFWEQHLQVEAVLKINQCGMASELYYLEVGSAEPNSRADILIYPANRNAHNTEWDHEGIATVLSDGKCFFTNARAVYF